MPEPSESGLLWQPAASQEAIVQRAALLGYLRNFFSLRQVLEVETPVLGRYGITDPHIDSVGARASFLENGGWLQTSPEYPMKRLIAAGSGPIYQVARVFRDGERGRRHNPEFSMLEWYRPGFTDAELMSETADLVCGFLGCEAPARIRYQDLFCDHAGIDPMSISIEALQEKSAEWVSGELSQSLGRDDCLNLLLTHEIEPKLASAPPFFLTDFPASQAALARIKGSGRHATAHRFELYIGGLELCNGYWELTDPAEQARRFAEDNRQRRLMGKDELESDPNLLAALQAGMPDCAGVALGLDRLLMLKLGTTDISDVLTFPAERV